MRMAVTRAVSPAIDRCQLAFRPREPIDAALARRQHEAYEQALRDAGCAVVRLPADDDLPDSVFVEDTAVVVDELAVIARSGAESRRGEVAAVAELLARYRRLVRIEAPGTLDGGDVLVAGRRVFVGESRRTNAAGIAQLARWLVPLGYRVRAVPVARCLHLKSAVTPLADDALLINPDWADPELFRPLALVEVHPAEPEAANVLRVGGRVLCSAACPRTRARIEARGFEVAEVDVSELAKAEGAVTCCSLIVEG